MLRAWGGGVRSGAVRLSAPAGTVGRWLAREAPEVVSSHSFKPRHASIAFIDPHRCVPSADGLPSGVSLWSHQRFQGDEFEAFDVADGSAA